MNSFRVFPRSLLGQLRSAEATASSAIRSLPEEARSLTDNDLHEARARAIRSIEELAGREGVIEAREYVTALLAVDTPGQRRLLPKPSISNLYPELKGVGLSNQQRALRSALRTVLYVGEKLGTHKRRDWMPAYLAVGWLRQHPLKLEIVRTIVCPACGASSQVNVGEKSIFRCAGCDHFVDGDRSHCLCEHCTRIAREFSDFFLAMLVEQEAEIVARYREWANESASELPTEVEMFRDYELHKNDRLGKNARAVLALRPSDGDDCLACIRRFCERFGLQETKLLAELVDSRVMYEANSLPPSHASLRTLLSDSRFDGAILAFRLDGRGGRTVHSSSVWQRLFQLSADELALRILLVDGESWFIFDDLGGGVEEVERCAVRLIPSSEWPMEAMLGLRLGKPNARSWLLNPNFIESQLATHTRPPPQSKVKCGLFRSATEDAAFRRLHQEYPNCLVVPNRLLRQVVGHDSLDRLKAAFSAEEFRYFWSCEVDMTVYTNDGELLFVEEIQRGRHHNDAGWIQKDMLKRQALELLGVPLRESF